MCLISITDFKEHDICQNIVNKLNLTYSKYYGFNPWTIDNLTRNYFDPLVNTYICKKYVCIIKQEKIEEVFILFIGKENLLTQPSGYFIDYDMRWSCSHVDLWKCSQLSILSKKLGLEHTIELKIPFVLNKNESFKDFVKSLHNNFNPHIFGNKSKKYSIEFTQDKSKILTTVVHCLSKYGAKRYNYLKSKGEVVVPYLCTIIFDEYNNFSIVESGISIISVKEEIVGFCTWKIINKIGYLHSIIINITEETKNLSLYSVLTIHTINHLFNKVRKINLGINFGNLGDYKKIFNCEIVTINLVQTIENTFENIEKILYEISENHLDYMEVESL